ncbi:hypothetical protein [Priestia aryabhattai]
MRVGITGHQDLGSIQKYNKIADRLKEIISMYPITYGYTCLAKGADQLFAEILIQTGVPYYAVVPSLYYENTFNDKGTLQKYKRLLQYAHRKKVLSFNQPKEEAFYAAGKYVTDSSDLLIAIWDGKTSNGLGGTGDIVKYGLELNKDVIQLNFNDLSITTISNKVNKDY